MSTEKDLLELEQNVHRESMKDGLQELLMALMLAFIGVVLVDGKFVIFLAIIIVFQTTVIEKFRRPIHTQGSANSSFVRRNSSYQSPVSCSAWCRLS